MRKLLNTLYVTHPKSYLCKDGESVVVMIEQQEKLRIPSHNIESIVMFNYMGCSPGLMRLANEKGISLVFLSPQGRFISRLVGPQKGNVMLRIKQYQLCENESWTLHLARLIIASKVRNSRMLLQRHLRDYGEQMEMRNISVRLKAYQSKIWTVDSKDTLRGYEGQCSRLYFSVFDNLILNSDKQLKFEERSRRPPKNPINAMLSFSYSLLVNDIIAALESVGLDAYYGVFHVLRPGRPSLALDLLEEFRSYLCDRFILRLVNRQQISVKHFIIQDDQSVMLTDEGRRIFLSEWQTRKKETITHPYIGESVELGLLPYIQAQLLSRFIREEIDDYPPFISK